MNYQKIYNQIIERAKTRHINEYTEKHHIIPKCIGGDNKKENLVKLTTKEHFLCHLLLVEIYPKNYKLVYALGAMANFKKYKLSSRTYGRIREEWSKSVKGRSKSKEFSDKLRKKKPNGFGEKISKALKGRVMSKESSIKKSIAMKNRGFKPHPLTHSNRIKALNKKVLQYDLQGNFIKEWTSQTEAGGNSKYGSAISACCRGKQNSAYGFVWKFKTKNYPLKIKVGCTKQRKNL